MVINLGLLLFWKGKTAYFSYWEGICTEVLATPQPGSVLSVLNKSSSSLSFLTTLILIF